jgi:hypothetical protein
MYETIIFADEDDDEGDTQAVEDDLMTTSKGVRPTFPHYHR